MSLFSNQGFVAVLTIVLLMLSSVLHELGHAAAAYACGDKTAKEAGRLTLNPLKHLDPFGSFVLPLLMVAANGPVFAYAKPVPFNPNRLRKPDRDEALVAAAGPASNLAQATVAAVVFRVMFDVIGIYESWQLIVVQVLYLYVYVNVSLMVFNLIPFPPLDGSKLISPLLHGKARVTYYRIQQYALPVLIGLLYIVPTLIHVDPLGDFLNWACDWVIYLLLGA